MKLLENILDRFFLYLRIMRTKSSEIGYDMVVAHLSGEKILIPVTIQAQQAMQTQFTGKRYRRTFSGYVIPRDSWKREYDALHHGPCPMAIWI